MARLILIAGVALALAGEAAAQPAEAPRPEPAPVAGEAHLVYRVDPHASPIEGRITVLQPAAPVEARERPADVPQVQITIFRIART
jgi:hypothetical protein